MCTAGPASVRSSDRRRSALFQYLRVSLKSPDMYCRFWILFVPVSQEQARCPLCRAQIKTKELVEYPGEEMQAGAATGENWRSSSKVNLTFIDIMHVIFSTM